MKDWRPDRNTVLLALASTTSGYWLLLELLGHHPDSGLLGVAAPLWAAWATTDRELRRRTARRRRRREPEREEAEEECDEPESSGTDRSSKPS